MYCVIYYVLLCAIAYNILYLKPCSTIYLVKNNDSICVILRMILFVVWPLIWKYYTPHFSTQIYAPVCVGVCVNYPVSGIRPDHPSSSGNIIRWEIIDYPIYLTGSLYIWCLSCVIYLTTKWYWQYLTSLNFGYSNTTK